MPLLSQRLFAAKMGVALSTVKAWKAMGWLVLARNDRIDEELSRQRLEQLEVAAALKTANPLDAILGGAPGRGDRDHAKTRIDEIDEGVASFEQARERKMRADAALAEAKLAEVEGRTVQVDEVTQAWVEILGTLRNAIRALPARICDDLAVETSAHKVRVRLEQELDEVLAEVSVSQVPLAPSARKTSSGRKHK